MASGYYDDSLDLDTDLRLVRPRIEGYFAGTYHPSYALPERVILVAEDGQGAIAGFAAGHRSTRMGCDGELQWMFVVPELQRRGVGSALVPPLARWFVEQGSTRVIIDASPGNPARAFYLAHGAVALDGYWLVWPDIGALLDG